MPSDQPNKDSRDAPTLNIAQKNRRVIIDLSNPHRIFVILYFEGVLVQHDICDQLLAA